MDEDLGFLRLLIALLLGGLFVMNGVSQYLDQKEEKAMKVYAGEWAKASRLPGSTSPRKGTVYSIGKESESRPSADYNENPTRGYVKKRDFPKMYAAFASDKHLYPANAFLQKYKPFDVSELWIALRFMGQHTRYILDWDNTPGWYRDTWQTPREFFKNQKGDCEDHAIFLVDWLIEMGYDARVALGEMASGGGHAWTVLVKGDDVYLIEATSKGRFRHFPLAKYKTDYHPEFMFNQDTFWVNDGSSLTTDYVGSRWKAVSRFQEAAV